MSEAGDQSNLKSEVCAKCNRPRRSSLAGSITQWISACECQTPTDPEGQSSLLEASKRCDKCGKSVDASRPGTLTQWIFGGRSGCRCAAPARSSTTAAPPARGAKLEDLSAYAGFEPVGFISSSRYKALKQLGSGASGSVFMCYDTLLRRKVAVKCLRAGGSDRLISFQNEAKASSRLEHPHIAAILDFGTDDLGVPFMVLEYVEGINLVDYVEKNGPLPVGVAISISRDLCHALVHAHRSGVLHRDIKTSNVILRTSGEEPQATLIDFGVARFKTSENKPTLGTDTIVGTAPYMAPDVVKGLPYDERSEVYSMGCVMFELLAGKPPLLGEDNLSTISLHAHAAPPLVSSIRDDLDVPLVLEQAIDKCLRKNPAERFQSMQEVLGELNAVVEEVLGTASQNDNSDVSAENRDGRRSDDSRMILWICAIAGSALLIGVGVIWWLSAERYRLNTAIKSEKGVDEVVDMKFNVIRPESTSSHSNHTLGVLFPRVGRDAILAALKTNREHLDLGGADLEDADLALLKGSNKISTLD
ncbi:MAG: serine/threonine protein kinase, partial [Cyanobacteria bacterium]|nr:serine/threonine protein kinase [Cyanobacteriota bacterium]